MAMRQIIGLGARLQTPALRVGVRRFSSESWKQLEKKADGIVEELYRAKQTVGIAEWTSGGLISAALWSSRNAHVCFRGSGVRLAYGINRAADQEGVNKARDFAKSTMSQGFPSDKMESSKLGQRELGRWGLVYNEGVEESSSGTPVHALELAHAARFNLETDWGIGESSVPGPDAHHRHGTLPGMGFVAVAGPTPETTGVLKIGPSDASRSENMARIANAALDLMVHLQEKHRDG